MLMKLTTAHPGKTVWVLDPMDKGFGSDGKRVVGVGAFHERPIEGCNHQSITVDGVKYNIVSGMERGAKPNLGKQIFGDIERRDFELVRVHRTALGQQVAQLEDPYKLHQIADILDFKI